MRLSFNKFIVIVAAGVMTIAMHPLTWAYLEGAPAFAVLCQPKVVS